jgi:hypothetical protein
VGRCDRRTAAELHDALSVELTYIDRWDEAADERTAGLALDDQVRVGDGLGRLATVMWRLCRGAETTSCAAEAVAVLEPLGPTPELGWALVSSSSR